MLVKKIFWSKKNLGPKYFLSKKPGRVNPRGGYMTPSPQKIVGLKFCWFVVSCPKRFFVKKKNIGRVNPGGGGVDDPPTPRK